jgi:NADH:ubiquinone oxidoreductase subunit B-like Fe-S oxidoreductase
MNTRDKTLGPRQDPWRNRMGLSFQTMNRRNFFERMKSWSRSQLLSSFVMGGNCCTRELYRLSGPNPQARDVRESFTETEPIESCDVLIVSGVITLALKPYLLEAYERMLRPRYVMAVGTCSASGAVFETIPLEEVLPVDVYVSGCPPTLDTLICGLESLKEKVATGDHLDGGNFAEL